MDGSYISPKSHDAFTSQDVGVYNVSRQSNHNTVFDHIPYGCLEMALSLHFLGIVLCCAKVSSRLFEV